MLTLKLVVILVVVGAAVAAPAEPDTDDTLQDLAADPKDYILKFKDFFKHENFAAVTNDEELLAYIKNLVEWEEPEYIHKNFPYFQTGYDMKGQPAWVAEFGKYDILKFFEAGMKTEDLEKYNLKAYVRIVESLHHATGHKMNANNAPQRIRAIIDFDGLELPQLGNRQVIDLYINMMKEFQSLINSLVDEVYIINADFVTRMLLEAVRPFFGELQEKLKIYGVDEAEYTPVLHKVFGVDSLPEWYGGKKDHKPLKVYG